MGGRGRVGGGLRAGVSETGWGGEEYAQRWRARRHRGQEVTGLSHLCEDSYRSPSWGKARDIWLGSRGGVEEGGQASEAPAPSCAGGANRCQGCATAARDLVLAKGAAEPTDCGGHT
jgi:hypothetical protein